MDVDGLLLDIDGVLAVSWEPIAGAVDTLSWIRERGDPVPARSRTPRRTRARRSRRRSVTRGSTVDADRDRHGRGRDRGVSARRTIAGARVFLLSDGDARADLEGVTLVGADEPADVVVIGGASDDFTYADRQPRLPAR